MRYGPPIIGWDDDDCARTPVVWRDGTPIAGILGKYDAESIAEARAKQLAEEAEEARREELRTLYENVEILDDHRLRRKQNGYRTTL
jgi:hypothetical protein